MSVLERGSLRSLRRAPLPSIGLLLLIVAVYVLIVGRGHARGMLADSITHWNEELQLADLEVLVSPTHPETATDVAALEGVDAAEGRLLVGGFLEHAEGPPDTALFQVLGTGPPQLNRLHLLAGRHPEPGAVGALIDRSVVHTQGIGVGDTLRVRVLGEQREVPVTGVVLSPDHPLFPVHPEFALPLRGSMAVIWLSQASVEGIEHSDRITSILVRAKNGGGGSALESEVLGALSASVLEVRPQAQRPAARITTLILAAFDAFMVPVGSAVTLTALLLLLITWSRQIGRLRGEIGALLAAGLMPARIALSMVPRALLPTAGGIAIGSMVEGRLAAHIYESYANNVGFPPLRDPGVGSAGWITAAGCLLFVGVASFVIAYATARRRPGVLLRGSRGHGRTPPTWVSQLRKWMRIPTPVVLGLQHGTRRPFEASLSALSLGLSVSVAGAILVVHLTHAHEIDSSIQRMSLDAVVHMQDPQDDDAIAALGVRAGGEAEAIITRLAFMQTTTGASFHRAIGAAEGRWLSAVRLGEGRALSGPDARELVIDYSIAHRHGLRVGDDVQLYPGPQAPEGVWVTIVGITDGLSTGTLLLPLETARTLFGLPGLATGAQITSGRPPAALDASLREVPGLQALHVRAFATQELRANFKGMTAVILIAMFLSAMVVVVYIAVLSGLDAEERAPELATLEAIGWPASALLLTSVTEVYVRGILALLLALLATPLISAWLLGNIAASSQIHLRAVSHWMPCIIAGGLLLLLLPLSCWPSWRAFRRTPPAVSLRRLG